MPVTCVCDAPGYTIIAAMDENATHDLKPLGWDEFFQTHFDTLKIPGAIPARVISQDRDAYQLYSPRGDMSATISGKMRYHAKTGSEIPAVGDWVVVKPLEGEERGIIHALLPRKSKFSRKAAGELLQEQIVSANVDTVFIVSGLDGGRNFNLRRIERYLTLAWGSGAVPVVVLNKADVCPDVTACISSVEAIAPGVPVLHVSARERTGLEGLRSYLAAGKTVAFLGSSGVGKSALINALLGVEKQGTGVVRANDHQGRHTTTRRELILLPGGGIMIDTPGMREIQMWADEEDLEGSFKDIETLAEKCRFTDCLHNNESGCEVNAAVERGELSAGRVESYRKLQKEIAFLAAREETSARAVEKAKWKKVSQWNKSHREKT